MQQVASMLKKQLSHDFGFLFSPMLLLLDGAPSIAERQERVAAARHSSSTTTHRRSDGGGGSSSTLQFASLPLFWLLFLLLLSCPRPLLTEAAFYSIQNSSQVRSAAVAAAAIAPLWAHAQQRHSGAVLLRAGGGVARGGGASSGAPVTQPPPPARRRKAGGDPMNYVPPLLSYYTRPLLCTTVYISLLWSRLSFVTKRQMHKIKALQQVLPSQLLILTMSKKGEGDQGG